MLDVGFPELLLIIAVAVLVIGPKEIPQVMYGLGKLVRRLQYLRFSVTRHFNEFMEEADLNDMQEQAQKRVMKDGDTPHDK